MCVRLSPSHPAARIVVGLYILLATFLIGFFGVQITKSNLFNNATIGQQSSVADFDRETTSTSNLDKLLMTRGCANADDILIWRWHDVPLAEMPSGTTIGITNKGSVPIHPESMFVDSWAPAAGRNEYTRIDASLSGKDLQINRVGHSFEAIKKTIEHSQTHTFWLPLIDDDRIVVTFDYKLGEDPTNRRVHARIPAGSQFAISCF